MVMKLTIRSRKPVKSVHIYRTKSTALLNSYDTLHESSLAAGCMVA